MAKDIVIKAAKRKAAFDIMSVERHRDLLRSFSFIARKDLVFESNTLDYIPIIILNRRG